MEADQGVCKAIDVILASDFYLVLQVEEALVPLKKAKQQTMWRVTRVLTRLLQTGQPNGSKNTVRLSDLAEVLPDTPQSKSLHDLE